MSEPTRPLDDEPYDPAKYPGFEWAAWFGIRNARLAREKKTGEPSLKERLHTASAALERDLARVTREKDAYAELAGSKCVIQKVVDELGPVTLCTVAEYRAGRDAERRASEAERAMQDAVRALNHAGWNDAATIVRQRALSPSEPPNAEQEKAKNG